MSSPHSDKLEEQARGERIAAFHGMVRLRFKDVTRVISLNGDTADLLGIEHGLSGLQLRIRWHSTGVVCSCSPAGVSPCLTPESAS